MPLLFINSNQVECLKHYERMEVEEGPLQHHGGPTALPTLWACKRKGLIERTERGLVVSALGYAALNAYPNPLEVTP